MMNEFAAMLEPEEPNCQKIVTVLCSMVELQALKCYSFSSFHIFTSILLTSDNRRHYPVGTLVRSSQ